MRHQKDFSELFSFQKKSKFKASEGSAIGLYPFYTSSTELSKRIDTFLFDIPCLVFGTGGQASVHYCDEKFSVSTDCLVAHIKNPSEVYLKYVYYYLSGNIRILEQGFKGAGLKHISKEYISQLKIPLPPLETQKKIAAILDKADELRQNDKKILEKYDQLAQSVFLEMFGDPVRNREGWRKQPMGELLGFLTSGSRGWAKYYSNDGEIFLRIENVGRSELILNELKYVKVQESAESRRTKVKSGDLLLSITADLGRTCVIPNDFPIAYINQHLAILRLRDGYNPYYISEFLSSPAGQTQFKRLTKGGVKAGLNFDDIKSLEIILPPIELQERFVSVRNVILKQIELTKRSSEKSEELFQSLLQRAFRGELV